MTKRVVVVCVDGLDPAYLEACKAPTMETLSRKGFSTRGTAMVPTVTNVNNVSIVTGCYPAEHGIATNYWFDVHSRREVYMESAEYLRASTFLERASQAGLRSALVTAKDKLRALLDRGTTVAVSSEKPLPWLVRELGEAPPIYSLEVNGWVMRTANLLLSRKTIDVAYVATTDYAMHTYAPESQESQRHISILDNAIADLVASHPDIELLVTADHGMKAKHRMVDLEATLSTCGIRARAVPVIKDRYVVHHSNLGGCIYVYIESGDVNEAKKALRDTTGVEDVVGREDAAARYRLPPERIGDMVVLGKPDVVFGSPSQIAMSPNLRSHGSLHERDVPIIGYGGDFRGFTFHENRDIGEYIFERLELDRIE
jgi:phosphonoacetate hydrolase